MSGVAASIAWRTMPRSTGNEAADQASASSLVAAAGPARATPFSTTIASTSAPIRTVKTVVASGPETAAQIPRVECSLGGAASAASRSHQSRRPFAPATCCAPIFVARRASIATALASGGGGRNVTVAIVACGEPSRSMRPVRCASRAGLHGRS